MSVRVIRCLLQKQFDLSLPCLSRPFWQAGSFRNFRTFNLVYFVELKFANSFGVMKIKDLESMMYFIYVFI